MSLIPSPSCASCVALAACPAGLRLMQPRHSHMCIHLCTLVPMARDLCPSTHSPTSYVLRRAAHTGPNAQPGPHTICPRTAPPTKFHVCTPCQPTSSHRPHGGSTPALQRTRQAHAHSPSPRTHPASRAARRFRVAHTAAAHQLCSAHAKPTHARPAHTSTSMACRSPTRSNTPSAAPPVARLPLRSDAPMSVSPMREGPLCPYRLCERV